MAAGLAAAMLLSPPALPGAAAGERPTTLVYTSTKLRERLVGRPARGPLDAHRPRQRHLPRRLEEREGRPDRVRAPLRAPDVPGQQERRPGSAPVVHRLDRRREQRLDERGLDQLLGDGAGALPAAGAVARGRSDGLAQGRAVGVHARAQRREGGAAAARRQPALRTPRRDRLRRDVHHASLQAPGDRQHGRPRGGAHRGRARLLRDLLRAGERRARHRRRLRPDRDATELVQRYFGRVPKAKKPVPRDIPAEPAADRRAPPHRLRGRAAAGGRRRPPHHLRRPPGQLSAAHRQQGAVGRQQLAHLPRRWSTRSGWRWRRSAAATSSRTPTCSSRRPSSSRGSRPRPRSRRSPPSSIACARSRSPSASWSAPRTSGRATTC